MIQRFNLPGGTMPNFASMIRALVMTTSRASCNSRRGFCLERKNLLNPQISNINPVITSKCLYKNRGETLQHLLQRQELQSSLNHLLGRDTSGLSHTLTKYLSTWHFEASCHKAASNVLPRIEKRKDSKISKQSEPFVSLECLLSVSWNMLHICLTLH